MSTRIPCITTLNAENPIFFTFTVISLRRLNHATMEVITTPKKIKAIVTEKVGHYQLDNVSYVPGDVVEVSPHLFERGCAIGHLKPVPDPEPIPEFPELPVTEVPEAPTEEETITVEPAAGPEKSEKPETTKKSAKTKTKQDK